VTAGAAPVAVKVFGATVLAALAVGAGYTALGHHGWGASAARFGAHAAPSAMTGTAWASPAGGTTPARSARDAPTLERGRGGSILATQRGGHARAATAGTPRHNASGVSANAGIAVFQPSGAPQTPRGSRASGGVPGSGHGHGHAYGHSGANGHGSAGAAMSKPHQPPARALGHRQPHGNGRGHPLASGHSGRNGHGRLGPATGKTQRPTRPPAGQEKPSGNPGKRNAKT
jgi:hypothetical protein